MKTIWIDITNSPHVLFFEPLINELKKKYKIIVTARDYQQTVQLLKQKNIDFIELGKHHGKNKITGTLKEVIERLKFIVKHKPDLTISHHAYYNTIAACLTGRSSLYIFDGDGTKRQILGILFATSSLCPEVLPQKRIFLRKLIKYPGLKEEIYLENLKRKTPKTPVIILRPEATQATYIKQAFILDPLIQELIKEKNIKIILIPRTDDQREYYKKYKNIEIPGVVDGPELISKSSLVISAGGTMNREAAVLGVPVISAFQNIPLSVDKWLVNNNYMKIIQKPTIEDVKEAIKSKHSYKKTDKGKKFILSIIDNLLQ